eukprot:835897-Pelagomonas_calceolata.AAC.2
MRARVHLPGKTGNKASTVFGQNLSMRTCTAFFQGIPCQVWGPRREYAHFWGPIKTGSNFNQGSWHRALFKSVTA